MRVELPDGAWAEIGDPAKVTARRRRVVREAFIALVRASADDDGRIIPMRESYEEEAVAALVQAWSYPETPSTDAIVDLPSDAHDALITGARPLFDGFFPEFGADAVPKVPSGGSPPSEAG